MWFPVQRVHDVRVLGTEPVPCSSVRQSVAYRAIRVHNSRIRELAKVFSLLLYSFGFEPHMRQNILYIVLAVLDLLAAVAPIL